MVVDIVISEVYYVIIYSWIAWRRDQVTIDTSYFIWSTGDGVSRGRFSLSARTHTHTHRTSSRCVEGRGFESPRRSKIFSKSLNLSCASTYPLKSQNTKTSHIAPHLNGLAFYLTEIRVPFIFCVLREFYKSMIFPNGLYMCVCVCVCKYIKGSLWTL